MIKVLDAQEKSLSLLVIKFLVKIWLIASQK